MTDRPRKAEFEDALRRHVFDPWFPRCLDEQHGGFLCDFDRAWNPNGDNEKLLEFQARHTLAAAEGLRIYPEDDRLRSAVERGTRCLIDTMWDRKAGGWYHLTDRSGHPLEGHTKHTHGFAYAIQACAAVHAVTGSQEALSHAQEGLAWMDRFARDHDHGGYFGFLTRDGTVIRSASECPWSAERDTIDTEFGVKDLNVHSDLVETFVYLYRVWPDETVRARLDEIVDIASRRMVVSTTGAMHFFMTPDWQPIPHLVRAGYQCHNAFRILLASEFVGDADHLRVMACRMIDHALHYLPDQAEGGYFYAAPGASPDSLDGFDLRVRAKQWWVQMEALKALRAVSLLAPDEGRYESAFRAQWRYITRSFFDERYGGTYKRGMDEGPRWRRTLGPAFAPANATLKGDRWKDASHESRALQYCLETAID